jgi:enoyl-CoA hydratase/carnithine racemase
MPDLGLQVALDGAALRLTFDRPNTLNALTVELMEAATARVEKAATDNAVRVVVLTGAGRAFSSGADLGDPNDAAKAPTIRTLDAANGLVRAITRVPKPVVAAVNGLAAGVGCTIALSCDLAVTRQSAYFLLAFANIGLMPDGGATALVPTAIGRARAARMAMLGERVPAAKALDWGLISHVVDDEAFEGEVKAVVERLAQGPTRAYAKTKAAVNAATLGLLEQAHRLERAGQLELFATEDFAEGVRAFYERRPARFQGR